MTAQRILVTGAAGFLGSHLCDLLLAEGNRVVGVDNFCTGRSANLAGLKNEPRFTLIEQDICQLFDPGHVDYLFNFASPASPADYARLGPETLNVGSIGARNVLDLARKHGAEFLHASTSECYGDPEVHPQVETHWGRVNPVGPRSVYDEAKRFSEALVMAYHRYYNINTHMVRIFNTYGPRLHHLRRWASDQKLLLCYRSARRHLFAFTLARAFAGKHRQSGGVDYQLSVRRRSLR